MMTIEYFLVLLKDESKCKAAFGQFEKKYRNIFDRIIKIKYSDKRYEAVDVHSIYYTDFMPFVINQLEIENKTIPFDNWVTKLADKRVKDIRPKVRKSLAKVLLEKGGRENWDYLNDMMYTDFSRIVNNVIFRYFDKNKYSIYYDDVRITLLTHFYESRVDNHQPIKEVKDVDYYLYKMLKNIAINKKTRNLIDQELGLDHDDIDLKVIDRTDDDDLSSMSDELSSGYVKSGECQSINNNPILVVFKPEQSSNEEIWAEIEIEKLLSLLTVEYPDEAELLRKRKLYGHEYEELAEEYGCSVGNMHTKVQRAMVTLTIVALPHIKERCKKIFNENVDFMENQYYKDILYCFFRTNANLEEVRSFYKKKRKEFYEDLVKAFSEIKKINAKKQSIYMTDSDIEEYKKNEHFEDAVKSNKIIDSPNKNKCRK